MTFSGELKEFQEAAFERMIERRKVLVGYEMGLGKTVITIAAVEHLLDEGLASGGLVVVPSSLKYQWARQIEAFTDGEAITVVVDGTPTERTAQYAEIEEGGVEYGILNYEQVVNDWDRVKRLPRDFVVLDEATAIKNFAAKRTKRVKKLGAKYRFALSGQPIENKPEEVFSIMQWVDEDVLGRFDIFDKTFIVRNSFGGVKYYRSLPTLHERLSEAMVRKTRMDPDVRDQMPQVGEEIYSITFDPAGRKLYKHIAKDLANELSAAMGKFSSFDLYSHYHGEGGSADELAQRGRIMSRLTCLRMLCDHPDLLRISAEHYGEGEGEGIKGGSVYASGLLEEGLLPERAADRKALLKASPKLKETVGLIQELLVENPRNKVVVFAFFKEVLSMLQAATKDMSRSVLFTGDMSAKAKDVAKQTFMDDPRTRLFLSSDAGGYGVDLPNANHLISYDLPWSAGKLDQRNARIIRLSSEFEAVTLHYMLMAGSIEERQFKMLEQKQAIASAVVDGKGYDRKTGRLTLDLKSLSDFLRDSDV
jgi:SNF2 family DNA or RNA helicase